MSDPEPQPSREHVDLAALLHKLEEVAQEHRRAEAPQTTDKPPAPIGQQSAPGGVLRRLVNWVCTRRRSPALIVFGLALWGAAAPGLCAELQDDFAAGRAYFDAAEFKKAAAHFEAAVAADPDNAESCFWLGRSYEALVDINMPFYGVHRSSKAHLYLARAVALDPSRQEYQREFFYFLLDSADHSRKALDEAALFLRNIPEADSDLPNMLQRLEEERKMHSSAEYRLTAALRMLPPTCDRLVELASPRLGKQGATDPARGR
jgi:tetratricopeptide (TPR) repeat protein